MSGALIHSDLFTLSRALAAWIIENVVNAIINAIALVIPPLTGLSVWLASDPVLDILGWLVAITIFVTFFAAINLFVVMWIERKMYSRLQDRYGIMISIWSLPFWPFNRGKRPTHLGTGFLQNVADGVKLLQKENITPVKADKWMFHAAPAIIASSTLLIFVAIPFSEGFTIMTYPNPFGILLALAAFSIAPLGILIAGWSSNNKYTLVGGMRAAAMLISYEIPMILCVIAVVMLSGTLDPFELVKLQERSLWGVVPSWYVLPQILGFVVFFVAMVAELERLPFDLPEAEAELVEGWTTEYSGMRFGLVYGFKWLRAVAGAALMSILYLGGWSGPVFFTFSISGYEIPILPQEVWMLLRVYIIFVIVVWIAWSLPRVRIDQILNIGWKRLIPLSILTILLAAFVRTLGWF